MQSHKHLHLTDPTIRLKHLPILENELHRSFFRLFDLLGLDEELMPLRLQKPVEQLPCKPKGGSAPH
jgi:hypothetical protein